MKKVTIIDIAKYLNLSTSTVSRALSGDKKIKRETHDLIVRTAEELGYRRNRLAVSLRSGRTNIVGVIVDEMETPESLHLLAGAEQYFHDACVNMMVANSEKDVRRECVNLAMMESAQVDGLLVMTCSRQENIQQFLSVKRAGIPIVFFNEVPVGLIASSVNLVRGSLCIDYRRSGQKGAELLVKEIQKK